MESRPLDESPTQIRELPQIQSLRIAPLQQPVSSRALNAPSPLEPNASGVVDPNNNNASKANASGGSVPASLPTLTELLDAARSENTDSTAESRLSMETPPKPILPAFVNLRAIERFPYSFHEDSSHVPRKRRRVDTQSESLGEHLQLPVPQSPKEQRPPPFGPFAILNGLNEPPPNAALLPPIESGSIARLLAKPTEHGSVRESSVGHISQLDTQQAEKRQGRIDEILDSPIKAEGGDKAGNQGQCESSNPETQKPHRSQSYEDNWPISPKSRGRSRKNTRKWSDEETTALLRGVVKCGIGKWTAILKQPELKFNKRSAANLKDRFRVCCPWAYQASDPVEAVKKLHKMLARAPQEADTDGTDGKTVLPGSWQGNSAFKSNFVKESTTINSNRSSRELAPTLGADLNSKARKRPPPLSMPAPTPSTKSRSTFASLGIPEPSSITMKSRKRSRCPFTVAEDEALLKGYAIHGFKWTLIQQDGRLNLGHRKPTHLRDRFRIKFPGAYNDDGTVSDKACQTKITDGKNQVIPHSAGGGNHEPTKRIASLAHSCSRAKIDNHNINTDADDTGNDAGIHHGQQQAMLGPGPIDPGLPQTTQGLLQPSLSSSAPLSSSMSSALTGASSSTAASQFPMTVDENVATNSSNPSSLDAAAWEDNTLPPVSWDDFP